MGLHPPETHRIMRGFHLWNILVMIGAISYIYYEWKEWFPGFWYYFMFEFQNHIIGVLFLIPFIYASIIFWWRGSLIVWVISMSCIMPLLTTYYSNSQFVVTNITFFFFPLAIIIIIAFELRWIRRQKKAQIEKDQERQTHISRIIQEVENERWRISRELHDDTTQELILVANCADRIIYDIESLNREQISAQVRSMKDSILSVYDNVRRISLDLRPDILDNIGLVPALRWLADRLIVESGIQTRVSVRGSARKLQADTEINVFRIAQEALSNIRQHSKAVEATIVLSFEPSSFKMTIKDNGIGFNSQETLETHAVNRRMGIIGIQQRAKLVNGVFNITSEIGKGTELTIEITEKPDLKKSDLTPENSSILNFRVLRDNKTVRRAIMVRKKYTEEQIIAVLREAEAGAKLTDLCRKYGMSEATYYNWKAKYAGMA